MKKKEIIRLEKILTDVGFYQHENAFTVDLGLDKNKNSYTLYWHVNEPNRFFIYKITDLHPCCDVVEIKNSSKLPKDVFENYKEIMTKLNDSGVVFDTSKKTVKFSESKD